MKLFIWSAMFLWFTIAFTSCESKDKEEAAINEEYIAVLEEIVIKQRNELFERGYATDNSIFVNPKHTRDWGVKSYNTLVRENKK
jgi:hypothetical protein